MVNKLWFFFIVSGIAYAFLSGNVQIINEEILKSANTSFTMVCQILPVIALWLGIMNIAKKSGLLEKLSKGLSKILKYIFPEIPKNHESFGYIASNMIANLFGLGNAATPFGLKAMKSLQTLNPKKTEASRSMITFLVLNTSGLTLIPTTIISLRMMHHSANPSEIVLACILATLVSTTVGLIADRILYKVTS
ncbi:MAG: nucleoside recognition domain-containing protein [Bacilli bacterium]|nr:nucleoside recognition domain-containing protein [Bacilli bacterium]